MDVTWAPKFTTHAVANPFPHVAAKPSWSMCEVASIIIDSEEHEL